MNNISKYHVFLLVKWSYFVPVLNSFTFEDSQNKKECLKYWFLPTFETNHENRLKESIYIQKKLHDNSPPMGYLIFCRKLVCRISPCIVSHNHKTCFSFLSRKYFTQHSMYAIFHQLFGCCRRKEYKVEVVVKEFWATFFWHM